MLCPLCGLPCEEEATFATLFRLDSRHPSCKQALADEWVEEVVPIFESALEIVWFKGNIHPLHFRRVFQDALHSGRPYVFFEPAKSDFLAALPLLAGLFKPLRIYAERYFTLDQLETVFKCLNE